LSIQDDKKKDKQSEHDDDEEEEEEEQTESLSSEDALWFPIIGSGVLFGLYLLFRFFSKEYINYLLTAYFALLGTGALTKLLDSIAKTVVPGLKTFKWNERFQLKLWKRNPAKGSVFCLFRHEVHYSCFQRSCSPWPLIT
jgi:minor histocompatibility antigen H13